VEASSVGTRPSHLTPSPDDGPVQQCVNMIITIIIIIVNRCPPPEPEETRLYKSISRARRTSYRRAPISRRDRCPTTVYIYLSLVRSHSLTLSHSLCPTLCKSLALALSDHSCNNHRRTIAVSRARTLDEKKTNNNNVNNENRRVDAFTARARHEIFVGQYHYFTVFSYSTLLYYKL